MPLSALLAGLGLMLVGRGTAQVFTTVHNFTGPINGATNGTDGAYPAAGLTLSGDTLYGTTSQGGSAGVGTVFSIKIDGSDYTVLHTFGGDIEGGGPEVGVVLSGNTLYGTGYGGGSAGNGTVFKVNTDGTGFTNLYSFSAFSTNWPGGNKDGGKPRSGLTLAGNRLYGTTLWGGPAGGGTVFKVNTDGTGFGLLMSFTRVNDLIRPFNNYGGANPQGGTLVLDGGTLYGTAASGGSFGFGSVYAVNSDGTGFRTLHDFAGYPSDGATPFTSVFLSGKALYGTTSQGGSSGIGAIFKVNTDGTGYEILHSLSASDGAFLATILLASNNTLYAGTAFSMLGLVSSSNTFFGTEEFGGTSSRGTVYSLVFPPQLSIISLGEYMLLSWPTNFAGIDYSGYVLQSAANLASMVWSTNSPSPVVINEQYTVTNLISGTQRFYRLRH